MISVFCRSRHRTGGRPRHARSALLVLLVLFIALAAAQPANARSSVQISVDPHEHGTRLAESFLGFSTEYNTTSFLFGGTPTEASPAFVQLMRNITAFGSGAPVLRIGGSSTDASWWNPSHV